MPTLEEILKANNSSVSSFLDKYGSKKNETEEEIVSDALAAPVRPEYLALLEKAKKETIARPEGARSFLGTSSPEEVALKKLEEYDALRTAPPGAKSNFQAGKQKDYETFFNKTKPSESLAGSSAPFFPTPTGAPIAEETPITTSQAAARLPAASGVSTKEVLPSAEKESDVSSLLKTAGAESSQYQDLLNRYKEAEERQRLAQLGVSLGQAGERIGSAIAMVKPGDQAIYEQLAKQAGGITEQFKEEEAVAREAKRNDPNSEESKSARALLKEQGIPVPETVTAAFIEKQYPQFANILAQRRAAEERAEARKVRAEERAHELERETKKTANEFVFSGLKTLTGDKVYMTRNKVLRGKALVDEALKNPSGFGDVTSLYSAITALDPDSVVREGEIKLSREGMSLGESIQREVTRIGSNPRLINDRLLKDIKKYVDLIDKQTEETYNLKRDALFQQAENRGIAKDVYRAMDPFSLKKERTPQATEEEKVVVEKDGKKYRLKKSQLEQAIAQGYKEVK